MKKNAGLISVVVLNILLLTSNIFGKEPARLAPDFKLMDVYQNIYTLSEYRGKSPVLLFFWATWCPFCQKELSVLNQSYAGLAEDGLEVFAINTGEFPAAVENFIASYHLSYRVLLDKDQSVAYSYGIVGIPVYILIDKEGNVVFQDSYLPYGEYKDLISKSEPQSKK